jgi:hypothetical protein
MKNSKMILILILLTSLTLGLVACGGEPEPTAVVEAEPATATPLPPTDTPTPTDTPAPTDTSEPVEPTEAEPGAEAEALNLEEIGTPSDLSSYRADMTISISGTEQGEAVAGTVSFLTEYTADPLAQHVVISSEGLEGAEEMQGIEMYQVEGTTYLRFEDSWLSVPATEDVLAAAGLIQPEDVLEETCGWKKEGDTEYNGIQVEHWTTSKEEMEGCMAAEQLADMGELTAASGELYVAAEENYVVHMSFVFEGRDMTAALGTEDQVLDEGRMEFTFDMRDVNEPFVIELPEEALASSSLPEDIPFPDDAQEVANAFGMITFNSPSSAAEVADFYKAEMPLNGWTEVNVSDISGMFMMEYSKDGRTASLMISSDEDTGLTSVMITVQEEEG